MESPLAARILAGDVTGVMDVIDAMAPGERAASWRGALDILQTRYDRIRDERVRQMNVHQPFDEHSAHLLSRAATMACFMCDPETVQSDYWKHVALADIATFRQRYQLDSAAPLTHKQLHGEHRWYYRNHIHRAIIAGLAERPDTEEYYDSLFFGNLNEHANVILQHVDADPGIAPHLLALFEREGPSDGSFATSDQYCTDTLTWRHAFLTLCERGVYTRAQLLDKTLDTLSSDFPQFKANWFSQFHDVLAPTADELAERSPRYLALCHSRIGPTVTLALDAVTLLYKHGHVSHDQLCEAVQPVLTSSVKARVVAALNLLGQVVNNAPDLTMHVCAMAVHALAHPAADVQKKTIACLRKWGLHDEAREAARSYLPFAAAVNQAALAELLGEPPPQLEPVAAPTALAPARLTALDATRSIAPLTALADVVELAAHVLENPNDVDAWERAAAALVRMAPIPPAERGAFTALNKRARRMEWDTRPMGFAFGQLLACVLDGDTSGAASMVETPGYEPTMKPLIACRTHSLMAQAALGLGLLPLSAPSHTGGFIDPRQLAERLAAFQRASAAIPLSEQVFALMRLVPPSVEPVAANAGLAAARLLDDTPMVQALRFALGDAVSAPADPALQPLFLAAARIRSHDEAPALGPDAGGPLAFTLDWRVETTFYDGGNYVHHTLHPASTPELPDAEAPCFDSMLFKKLLTDRPHRIERDEPSIHFAASLLPSNLEPFFAEGVRAIGNNLDWPEARWQARAYLDVLLRPTTDMTPMARLVLALGLFGKEPGQSALAVDALVASARDGRLNVDAFKETLARLWVTPAVKGARLAASLAAASRADAHMPALVFALVCSLLAVDPGTARKDRNGLLDLLLELKLSRQWALPAQTATALKAMQLSGKAKLAAQALLA